VIEPEVKPRRMRILSGPVAVVEAELNTLLDSYGVMVWNFCPVGDQVHASVVLIAVSEMRKMQLMAGANVGRPH
jgi:hypothetical protein